MSNATPHGEATYYDHHRATVGRFSVARALPIIGRRMIGPWCFADHFGPADVTPSSGLDVGPHPHIGLQTVTWLTSGQVLHRDSLGSEQVIRPGQVNLMTAGRGITHAEEATGHYSGTLEGVQLWVAQTSETRNGDPRFEHHAELPRWQSERSEGIVFAGEHDTWRAPTTHDHPLVGQELWVHGSSVMSLRPDFEYGIVVLDGSLTVEHVDLEKGRLAYLRPGRDELPLASVGARAILLGGQPFQEKIVMWWNFVGRATEEFDAALTQWQSGDDRFGQLTSALPRFSSPQPWWGQQYRQFAR